MKRLVLPLAILCASLTACDKSYDINNLNKTIDMSVKVEDAQPEKKAAELIGIDAVVDAKGEMTVVAKPVPASAKCSAAEFKAGAKLADVKLPLPLSAAGSRFVSDDVYSSIENPALIVEVDNKSGNAFEYAGKVGGKPFRAAIPAAAGKHKVYISESGKVAPAGGVDAKVDGFIEIFKGCPKEITISDITVTDLTPKAGVRTAGEEVSFDFSYSGEFPLIMKAGTTLTIQETVDLSKMEVPAEYVGVKKIKVYADVKHNLPFTIEPKLVEPAEIVATCSTINGAKYPAFSTQEVVVSGECATGIKAKYDAATVNLTITATERTPLNANMAVQLTLKKYTVTK